jgi:hypothetical protein
MVVSADVLVAVDRSPRHGPEVNRGGTQLYENPRDGREKHQTMTRSSPPADRLSRFIRDARRHFVDFPHDPYLRFWKFPAWSGIWCDQECAALLGNSALFR